MKFTLTLVALIFATNAVAKLKFFSFRSKTQTTKPSYKINNILRDIPVTFKDPKELNLYSSRLESGWSGNGGDTHYQKDNIWNLGNKPVDYCIQVSEDFALSEFEVRELVKSSIYDWTKFFQSYGFDTKSLQGKREQIVLADSENKKISLNFNEVTCEELKKRNDQEELVFMFGKSNALVEIYKELVTEGALGLALRRSYNHETHRNGGIVWIENFTHDKLKIKHMLLHELGHVFGMKHDSVHVMDEMVADKLLDKKVKLNDLGVIESKSWKYKLNTKQKILLTNVPKKRSVIRRRKCLEKNYKPNGMIPNVILRDLKMDSHACHKVEFVVTSVEKGKRIAGVLKITESTGKVVKLTGNFLSKRLRKKFEKSPGVFTRVKMGGVFNPNKSKHRKLVLDKSYNLPAHGSFTTPSGTGLMARLSNDKGLTVEIAGKNARNWWILH